MPRFLAVSFAVICFCATPGLALTLHVDVPALLGEHSSTGWITATEPVELVEPHFLVRQILRITAMSSCAGDTSCEPASGIRHTFGGVPAFVGPFYGVLEYEQPVEYDPPLRIRAGEVGLAMFITAGRDIDGSWKLGSPITITSASVELHLVPAPAPFVGELLLPVLGAFIARCLLTWRCS